ncbi:carboxypeptidase regulatory-like domain-containing protein [Cytophagaceae bacterium YF14B1]|uniref:Carboxypeptidase regulatory-like domain-containing protein n=1 Tax=Xanthocytophaga flava TaxID=3048013 RepID=A0AAE3QZB6_9BACT|nr:carboxypeptidase regulatory-like domain-containing protein [Xanthocytophaga flavus]MDJ1486193.1 carboxypeptidase regulatory-like domain-containing protein [Xanthocytophaga flavus]
MKNNTRSIVLLLLFLLSYGFTTFSVNAQTTQASITGIILDNQKSPLPGATVQVRNASTGFTTATTTSAQGEYVFKQLPLGGPYTVTVTFVGYSQHQKNNLFLNQGDALRINVNMQEDAQTLDAIEITDSGLKNKTEDLGASTAITSKNITRMPVNGRSFASLTDLSPLSRGGNISGQLGSSTGYTIDGMNSKNPTSAGATTSRSGSPYSISIEAVREFKVVTNQYDVTYGRNGGGVVSAVTKSGTNTFSGSVFLYTRANWLSSRYDIRGNVRNNNYSTNQYGFSLSGPIIKDKLHFFVVWDHQLDQRSLVIADIRSTADESRFNIRKDTLDRFIEIARAKYGVADTRQYGSFDKQRNSDAGFLRLDWQINNRNLLTIRNNFTSDVNKLGLVDNTAINLYESTGNDYNVDNSLLATLRSSISPRLTNELKVQHLYTHQNSSPGDQLPSKNIPRAIVENVTSPIDGSTKSTSIQIGGHRFAQERFTNNVVQLIDNLYYNTNNVEYTFGLDVMYTKARSLYGSEVNGRFHYTNDANGSAMQNFENLRPYRYFREVPLVDDPTVVGNTYNVGLYGQMKTRLTKGLDVTAGLRMDYAHYPSAPLNQTVLEDLGLRTDNKLKSFIIQPRVQFNWNVNDRNRDFIRLGAGVFASDINNYMVINNLTFDGRHYGTVDVRNPNVPTPDFIAYRNNYNSIPSLSSLQIPTINMNGSDSKVPVVYKGNISYTRYVTDKLKVSVTGYATLGRNNYMYVDRNMSKTPFFTLANEDNRGVFVPLASMPSSGNGDWTKGRISNRLGRVLELTSQGKVNQFALVLDGTYQYFRDGEISVSYTWNDTKDNTSYNGNVANTATLSLPVKDDPRDLSKMTYSDNQFRNKVVIYGSSPTFYGFVVGIRYSGIGGTRYSLLSGANTNADFVATNDLAYIFDRNSTEVPENVRNGLQAIIDNPNASQSIKDYINKYTGKIAERNGGINGFYGTVDLRIMKRINFGKGHNLQISGDIFNVMNMLNRNKGTNKSLGSQSLYALGIPKTDTTPAVPGFDQTAKRYNYRVNSPGVLTPSGDPFQIQFGIRYGF